VIDSAPSFHSDAEEQSALNVLKHQAQAQQQTVARVEQLEAATDQLIQQAEALRPTQLV